MKHLKKFNESTDFFKRKVIEFLKKVTTHPAHYELDDAISINSNGEVDVSNSIYLILDDSTQKIPFKFGQVTGDFRIKRTTNYISKSDSLEKFPHTVGGDFSINNFNITSLEGCPEWVGGDFFLTSLRKLPNLIGCPKHIGGGFTCQNSSITSLEGCPDTINGNCWITGNKIGNLVGGPTMVQGDCAIKSNKLVSIEGLPKMIKGDLVLGEAGFDINLWDPTPMRDTEIGGKFTHTSKNSPLYMLTYFFESSCGEDWYNTFRESLDYNWIRGDRNNPKIDLFRFREALDEFQIQPNVRLFLRGIGPFTYVGERGERVDFNGIEIN